MKRPGGIITFTTALATSLTLLMAIASGAGAAQAVWDRAWGGNVDAVSGSGFDEVCLIAINCQPGSEGTARGGEFNTPTGVGVDAFGNVYVADRANDRIQKFDANGNFERAWGKDVDTAAGMGFEKCLVAANCKVGAAFDGKGGSFDAPEGLGVDPAGFVYVSDTGAQRVVKFDSSGNFLRAFGRDVDTSGDATPGICTDATLCQAGGAGGEGGSFSTPESAGIDAAGNVYVPEYFGQRVQKFDPSGNWISAWGTDVIDNGGGNTGFEICTTSTVQPCKSGTAVNRGGSLNGPNSVAVSAAGDLYVAENAGPRLSRFDTSGGFVSTWGKDVVSGGTTGFELCTAANAVNCLNGEPGSLGGELNSPEAVAVDATGALFVTEYSGSRIQRFTPTGTFVRAWGKDVITGGTTDYEVCATAANCKSGSSGGLGGEMNLPFGIAAIGDGTVYASDFSDYRVQKWIDPAPVTPAPPQAAAPSGPTGPTGPTGKRAAALKKCKKKKGAARKKCRKKAAKLPS